MLKAELWTKYEAVHLHDSHIWLLAQMNITGSRNFDSSRATVWAALHDVNLLRDSIPGCESIEWVSGDELEGKLSIKIGPVKAKFKMLLKVTNSEELVGYTLEGSAKAGALGFAGGQATVKLKDIDQGCELDYVAQVKSGGRIAQVGSRLLHSASKKYVDEFFTSMANGIES